MNDAGFVDRMFRPSELSPAIRLNDQHGILLHITWRGPMHMEALQDASRGFLHASELARMREFAQPVQLANWLCARVAIKRAFLQMHVDGDLLPTDLAIRSMPSGRPALYLREALVTDYHFSLTHDNGQACAILVSVKNVEAVGIDIGHFAPRLENLWVHYTTAAEQQAIAAVDNRQQYILDVWLLKEAIAKAYDIRLLRHRQEIAVLPAHHAPRGTVYHIAFTKRLANLVPCSTAVVDILAHRCGIVYVLKTA